MTLQQYKPKMGVYGLVDPRTGRTMYVGQSVDIERRYRQHIDPRGACSNLHFRRWAGELRRLGLEPRLTVLHECDWPELDRIERETIRQFRAKGEADLNISTGGRSRTASKCLNTNPDDWLQLANQINLASDLIYEIANAAGRMAGVRYGDRTARIGRSLCAIKFDLESKMLWLCPAINAGQ